ncbi:MAG: hypothetical protein HUK12_01660 [Muribaculaceae bacterium]|mgnify:FL=1|nr:hypothetical protein [Muribaculaceae bacterium]
MKKIILSLLLVSFATVLNASVFSQYAGTYTMKAEKSEASAPGTPQLTIVQEGTMQLAADDALTYEGTVVLKVDISNGTYENKLNFLFNVAYTGKAEWDGSKVIQRVNKESLKFDFKEGKADLNDAMAEAMLGAFEEAASRFGNEIKRELGDRTSHYAVKELTAEKILLVDDDNVEWVLAPVK